MGIIEVPASVMMKEAVQFMIPVVIRIMENRLRTRGVVMSCLYDPNCFFLSPYHCAETKLDQFTADCLHTLIRFMGHVTERPGKYFMLSRQTLYHMANTPGAVLAWIERKNAKNYLRYPCGGLVFVPDENEYDGMQVISLFLGLIHWSKNDFVSSIFLAREKRGECHPRRGSAAASFPYHGRAFLPHCPSIKRRAVRVRPSCEMIT